MDEQGTEETLFKAAIKLEFPEERSVYLKEASQGDEALLARIAALLQAYEAAG